MIKPREDLTTVYVLADAGDSSLDRFASLVTLGAPAGTSGFRLLPDACFSWQARRELAQRSQDVQYYLFRGDALGARLLQDMRDAAARGVRVRLTMSA